MARLYQSGSDAKSNRTFERRAVRGASRGQPCKFVCNRLSCLLGLVVSPWPAIRPAGFEPATLGLGNGSEQVASAQGDSTSDAPASSVAHQLPTESQQAPADPELARLIAAWPTLPPAIRAVILAAAEAAR